MMMHNGRPFTVSQEKIVVTDRKKVVLAVRHTDERQAITQLLEDNQMHVYQAASGQDVILFLEDHPFDFLISDISLPDMHAWKMMGTLKECVDLTQLPTIIIMDEQTVVPLVNVTPVVRPVSMAKLKHIIKDLFSA